MVVVYWVGATLGVYLQVSMQSLWQGAGILHHPNFSESPALGFLHLMIIWMLCTPTVGLLMID